MFNVKEVIREVEAKKKPESEGDPRAKRANCAKNESEISTISTISTFSTPPSSENDDIGKLETPPRFENTYDLRKGGRLVGCEIQNTVADDHIDGVSIYGEMFSIPFSDLDVFKAELGRRLQG